MSLQETAEVFPHGEESLKHVLEKHKQWLGGRGGRRADLRRSDMQSTNMKGVNLMGADLREALLDRACLNNADLRGADLRGARLGQASLIRTRLIAANLRSAFLHGVVATEADFTEANLLRADLSKAGLTRAVLRHANLRQATLAEAKLVLADFRGADLTGAELGGALLSGADLTQGDLSKTRLFGAHLMGADLSGANLDGADLRESRLGDSRLIGSRLTQADLTGADLNGACLDGADVSGWCIRRTACSRVLLSEAGTSVLLKPGEFEKTCLHPERILEFALSIPLGTATAYLAKCLTQSINAAVGTHLVVLKGLEAISTYETKVLMTCFEPDSLENTWGIKGDLLEKAMNEYFQSNPVKKDFLYLGDMLDSATGDVIDFGSAGRMFAIPWQINPLMIKEAIFEEYRRIGGICREIHSITLSVLGAGASRLGRPHGPNFI